MSYLIHQSNQDFGLIASKTIASLLARWTEPSCCTIPCASLSSSIEDSASWQTQPELLSAPACCLQGVMSKWWLTLVSNTWGTDYQLGLLLVPRVGAALVAGGLVAVGLVVLGDNMLIWCVCISFMLPCARLTASPTCPFVVTQNCFQACAPSTPFGCRHLLLQWRAWCLGGRHGEVLHYVSLTA